MGFPYVCQGWGLRIWGIIYLTCLATSISLYVSVRSECDLMHGFMGAMDHFYVQYATALARHKHLHLACALLLGRDLVGCLAYRGLTSCLVYYATLIYYICMSLGANL